MIFPALYNPEAYVSTKDLSLVLISMQVWTKYETGVFYLKIFEVVFKPCLLKKIAMNPEASMAVPQWRRKKGESGIINRSAKVGFSRSIAGRSVFSHVRKYGRSHSTIVMGWNSYLPAVLNSVAM